MKTLKDKGKIGHTQDILYKIEDVKQAVLKFENYVSNLQAKYTGNNCYDVFELLEQIENKHKEIFGDWKK